MNKWDFFAFICFSLVLAISFDLFRDVLFTGAWLIYSKHLLVIVGVYFFWQKGCLFESK